MYNNSGFFDYVTYLKRHDLPKYDFFEDLKFKVNEFAKPCPFCCGDVSLLSSNMCLGHGDYFNDYFIHCDNCNLDFHLTNRFYEKPNIDDFLNRWNNRI